MDARKLPANLKTADDYDRKLWGEILALHASIGQRLSRNANLYDTAKQAEQLARRLGRLDAVRTQVNAQRLSAERAKKAYEAQS